MVIDRVALAREEAKLRVELVAMDKRGVEIAARLAELAKLVKIRVDLDTGKLAIAARELHVHGCPYDKNGQPVRTRMEQLRKARLDVATVGFIRECYGTKTYAQWHDQDFMCTPGMAPSHGYVTFSVHQRTRTALPGPEIEAVLYALDALAQGAFDGDELRAIGRAAAEKTGGA